MLGSAGLIRSQEPTDSNKVCLTYNEFDFYAQKLVEYNGLKADTAIMGDQIRTQDKIITNIDRQLTNSQEMLINKDAIIDIKKKDFDLLSAKYTKQAKKLKAHKAISAVLAATSAILLAIVLLK